MPGHTQQQQQQQSVFIYMYVKKAFDVTTFQEMPSDERREDGVANDVSFHATGKRKAGNVFNALTGNPTHQAVDS